MRQQKRHQCIDQSYGLCGRGRGWEIWENSIETCIISCMKRVASPGLMHGTGCLGLVHWDDPEGWYGEGGGMRVQHGEQVLYTHVHLHTPTHTPLKRAKSNGQAGRRAVKESCFINKH